MNKKLLAILSLSMLSLVGCGGVNQQIQSDNALVSELDTVEPTLLFSYSLMNDEAVKNEVAQLMKDNGIPEGNINQFFSSVDQFNALMGDMKGITNGFETVPYPAELFDYDYIGTTWMKKIKFDDQQCRLTAFNLLKDVMNVPSEPLIEDPNYSLSGDLEIQKTNPNLAFTEDELKSFNNLYIEIPAGINAAPEALAEEIQAEWKSRGISFNNDVKASLMSVFLTSAESRSTFVGHAGIVLESEDGYVLVEKLAQYAPYVASKFNTLDELKAYLLSTYEPYIAAGMTTPLIFINDEWLQ